MQRSLREYRSLRFPRAVNNHPAPLLEHCTPFEPLYFAYLVLPGVIPLPVHIADLTITLLHPHI